MSKREKRVSSINVFFVISLFLCEWLILFPFKKLKELRLGLAYFIVFVGIMIFEGPFYASIPYTLGTFIPRGALTASGIDGYLNPLLVISLGLTVHLAAWVHAGNLSSKRNTGEDTQIDKSLRWIFSFAVSILGALTFLGTWIIAAFLATEAGLGNPYPGQTTVGNVNLGVILSSLMGIILATDGITKQKERRIFAILGLSFNSMLLLFGIAIPVLGLMLLKS
jgi:hypothetical protein